MAQQINMDGGHSRLLNDIKTQVRNGGNVTHILNVIVSKQRNAEERNRIREAIFRSIGNVGIQKQVRGMKFAITWRTSATATSTYYHCDVGGMLGDVAVKEHTKLLLRDLLCDLDEQFNHIFSTGQTGLAFLVTKPFSREVALVDDDDVHPIVTDVGEEHDEVAVNN